MNLCWRIWTCWPMDKLSPSVQYLFIPDRNHTANGTLWGGGIFLNSVLPRYMAFLSLLPNTNLACYNTLLEQWWSPTKIYLLTESLTLCLYCCSQYVAVKTLGEYLSRIIEGLDLLLWSMSNIIEFFFNTGFVISALVSCFFQMLWLISLCVISIAIIARTGKVFYLFSTLSLCIILNPHFSLLEVL